MPALDDLAGRAAAQKTRGLLDLRGEATLLERYFPLGAGSDLSRKKMLKRLEGLRDLDFDHVAPGRAMARRSSSCRLLRWMWPSTK
jgi:hypothetical protein